MLLRFCYHCWHINYPCYTSLHDLGFLRQGDMVNESVVTMWEGFQQGCGFRRARATKTFANNTMKTVGYGNLHFTLIFHLLISGRDYESITLEAWLAFEK